MRLGDAVEEYGVRLYLFVCILKLSRYIHLNPALVRGIKNLPPEDKIQRLRAYRWSSYRGYVGL